MKYPIHSALSVSLVIEAALVCGCQGEGLFQPSSLASPQALVSPSASPLPSLSASPTPSPTTSSSPSVSPSPSPSPSVSPSPSPSLWVGTSGELGDGTWHDPNVAPDSDHEGAYGGVAYAPNGDCYLFYETGSPPNENLVNVIRREGDDTWSDEYFVGNKLRTARLLFVEGQPYLAGETPSGVEVVTASNYSAASGVDWELQTFFQAADPNVDGYGAYGNAALVQTQGGFGLYYTYLYSNFVVGGESWGVQEILQTRGSWPALGSAGNPIDSAPRPSYSSNPHGLSNVFQDGSGDVLVFSSSVLKSADGGQTFTPFTGFSAVLDAVQNPTDGSILFADLDNAEGAEISIWGTRDFGATQTKIVSIPSDDQVHVKLAAVQNRIVLVFSERDLQGEAYLLYVTSEDGGVTWSDTQQVADATAQGATPDYTIGSFDLTVDQNTGRIALVYTVLDGVTHEGAYLREFY